MMYKEDINCVNVTIIYIVSLYRIIVGVQVPVQTVYSTVHFLAHCKIVRVTRLSHSNRNPDDRQAVSF